MDIKILNQEAELESFPSTQSIFLLSSVELEESYLDTTIILFRLQTENNSIKLAQPYSYSLGYLKESFDRVELKFKSEVVPEGFKITCTPTKPLNLDSLYCLYVTDKLSEKIVDVTKTTSKSNSNIKVKINSESYSNKTYTLKIEETSNLANNRNIVKLILDGVSQTIDLKSKNKIYSGDIEITLTDTVYVKDEEFSIILTNNQVSLEDFQYTFKTVVSSTITPIEKVDSSTKLSNQAILDYYQTINSTKVVAKTTVVPKYLSNNIFSIKLPEGFRLDTTDPEFKSSLQVAFNNYLLGNMGLYDSAKKYKVVLHLDEFEDELIFELLYGELDQLNDLEIDTSNLEVNP